MAKSVFQFGQRSLALDTPQVMGILNVTPDSFSDGGQLLQQERLDLSGVLRRAEAMVQAGATLLDIGGESTRPGAVLVSEQQELDRVVPTVELLVRELDVVVSVDTSTPVVMVESAKAGCGLINDVRALGREGALTAAAATGLPVCLMHMQGQPETMQKQPEYQDVVADVSAYLAQRMRLCQQAGIGPEQLLIDPGFGFGKTLSHNLQLLQQLQRLRQLDAPLLVGISRKSMIGTLLDKSVDQRLYGSLAAAALALTQGAWILRVHDVAATQDVVKVCQAVLSAGLD
ncbi:MAG: dihydropteroate synthase [Halopseudomonas sp.]